MTSPDLEKITKFTVEGLSSMRTPDFHLYMNGLDWADTVIGEKPASVLMHVVDSDCEHTAGFVSHEFPMLKMERLKKDAVVSYDKPRTQELLMEWSKPQKERDHYRVGTMLGYPESAARAFANPLYSVVNVTFDGYCDKGKFDEALFFAGHDWASVDDEASLSMGRRRSKMFLDMFGQEAYDEFANTYRQHLINFNPILEDYIPARPGYVKPKIWG